MPDPQWPKRGPLPLDPDVADWESLVGEATRFLRAALTNLDQGPTVTETQGGLTAEASDLNRWLTELFEPGFNPAHPGFMAYIPGGGLVTSALADWLIKTMNRYGTAHFAAPRLGELELDVIRTFARWVGYDERCAGVLTTGGSLANFTALVTARRAMLPEDFLRGVLYCSDQTHHSVMKAANLAGFSARNVHVVASDPAFRLDCVALRDAIRADREEGKVPFLVIGSAGTTNTGSIDPLREIARIARESNLWFHVDAAYGGAFVITERGRRKFEGMSAADSITLDPHKGLFLPYGTGSILVKDKDKLIEAHELRGEYMPELDRERAHLDPFSLSVELSREHRGLKVALPLILHGEEAFVEALDEKLDLTAQLYEALQAMPELELLHAPDLSTIAFRVNAPADRDRRSRALLDAINAGKKVFLSGTVLNGEFALRISILSHRTHRREVDTVLAEIHRALGELR